MRVYLVIMDETSEARKAMRFASRRAAQTGGSVHILALVARENFTAFGAVQATIEQEARDRAEAMANGAASSLYLESGKMPAIAVKVGDGSTVIREYLTEHDEVAALVLGAANEGQPGPLIAHFASHAGVAALPALSGAWRLFGRRYRPSGLGFDQVNVPRVG